MKRLAAATIATLAMAVLAAGAQADPHEYGIRSMAVSASTDEAGLHPDFTTFFELKTEGEKGAALPSTTLRAAFELPPGLTGNPTALPTCSEAQLVLADPEDPNASSCPQDSQVGVTEVRLRKNGTFAPFTEPIFNMEPHYGEPARFGFLAAAYPVFIDVALRQEPGEDYGATATVEGVSSLLPLLSANTTIWGVPADASHDAQRLTPYEALHAGQPETAEGKRKSGLVPTPFMINPTRCDTPQEVRVTAVPYVSFEPGFEAFASASLPANTNCNSLEFKPNLAIRPTTEAAESGSGLDADLTFPTPGLKETNLPIEAEQRKAEVTLPEGLTVNPSQAEGLGACSEAEFRREGPAGKPGEGCPTSAKIGSATARSPLLDEQAEGFLYVAEPFKNPFGTLIAVYLVLRIPDRGVVVRLAGKVVPNLETGQLVTTFDEIPQVPVESFRLHFREGPRSPLVTPSRCGTYTSTATFTAWSGQAATVHPSFQVSGGANGEPCPTSGPPLHPGFLAGTTNNAAGKYSPFDLRITRTDGEAEISRFSAKLPLGLTGKLAGIAFCPDAAIEAAKGKSGAAEEASPSCPAASQLGSTLVGAGAGSALTYVPGKIYLAGPYHGSLISIVAITTAKVGPFDLGTVVVREALKIDPETARVTIDSAASDPLPHIIDGIPTHLRDVRANTDRHEFMLNPTSCKRSSIIATVFAPGPSFASTADDQPATASTPFQAANCAVLPFKPKLKLGLRGGTHRGAHPSLTGILTMRSGEAGIARTQVSLPRSEFIENAHFKTICTRVRFAAGKVPGEACPAGSIYGHAQATTPLLSEPLSGPVYLRSSSHELPDMVVALNNKVVSIDAVARIDSTRGGGIRATFAHVPDAPVSKLVIKMQGAKKGLIVNSTNICKGQHRASVAFDAQNGKSHNVGAPLSAKCP